MGNIETIDKVKKIGKTVAGVVIVGGFALGGLKGLATIGANKSDAATPKAVESFAKEKCDARTIDSLIQEIEMLKAQREQSVMAAVRAKDSADGVNELLNVYSRVLYADPNDKGRVIASAVKAFNSNFTALAQGDSNLGEVTKSAQQAAHIAAGMTVDAPRAAKFKERDAAIIRQREMD